MLETPQQTVERILQQVRFRPDCKVFYIAWGSSLRFIAFSKNDFAFEQYGEDLERLVGAYTKPVNGEEILEDLLAFIQEKGFKI